MPQTTQGPTITVAEMIAGGASVADLVAAGYTANDIAAAVAADQESKNRSAQAALTYDGRQSPQNWAARKAWLLDGQAIHGQNAGLADFYYPARNAVKLDDQEEFARQKDLLFKAVATFLGDQQ